ncbi:hypothetical protein VCHA49P380_130178 [Vibrio chagasii]|nr:hypothetical protein VCHA49P380_130178 [Vibrio chagasii]
MKRKTFIHSFLKPQQKKMRNAWVYKRLNTLLYPRNEKNPLNEQVSFLIVCLWWSAFTGNTQSSQDVY